MHDSRVIGTAQYMTQCIRYGPIHDSESIRYDTIQDSEYQVQHHARLRVSGTAQYTTQRVLGTTQYRTQNIRYNTIQESEYPVPVPVQHNIPTIQSILLCSILDSEYLIV